MRLFRLLGLTFIGLVAIACAISTNATATEIKILPEASETNPIKFKFKSGASVFEQQGSSYKVKCASDKGSGEWERNRRGPFSLTFEKCLASAFGVLFLCTGLSATENSSNIPMSGRFIAERINMLDIAITFVINQIHYTCVNSGLGISVLIRGRACIAGLILPVNTRTKTYTIKEKETKGADEITEVLNEAETEDEKCVFEESEGTGAFTSAGMESTEEMEGSEQEGHSIETELMA
jgi:hypothetical protein